MTVFDVYLNDRKRCRAGVGPDGVLTAIVNWVKLTGPAARAARTHETTAGGIPSACRRAQPGLTSIMARGESDGRRPRGDRCCESTQRRSSDPATAKNLETGEARRDHVPQRRPRYLVRLAARFPGEGFRPPGLRPVRRTRGTTVRRTRGDGNAVEGSRLADTPVGRSGETPVTCAEAFMGSRSPPRVQHRHPGSIRSFELRVASRPQDRAGGGKRERNYRHHGVWCGHRSTLDILTICEIEGRAAFGPLLIATLNSGRRAA